MIITSTEFRKNLFQIVDRALQGEFVEVSHKGRLLQLVPHEQGGKLQRLVKRDTIAGTRSNLEKAQKQLDAEMRKIWEAKWARKL